MLRALLAELLGLFLFARVPRTGPGAEAKEVNSSGPLYPGAGSPEGKGGRQMENTWGVWPT